MQVKQFCGSKNNDWYELKVKATRSERSMWALLRTLDNSVANNESFTIDNSKTISARFKNAKDQQDWSCGKVQSCGSLDTVYGGYNTKAKSHFISKTFTNLPADNYKISLDFIKIDSWYALLV